MRLSEKNILKIYIIIYPLVDILYTITQMLDINIKFNQLIRGIMLIFMLLLIRKQKYQTIIWLITIWVSLSTCVHIVWGYSTSISTDISVVLKILTNFIVFYCFLEKFSSKSISLEEILHWLILSAFIASISVLLSYVGLGNTSYDGIVRRGVKGFFTMQSSLTIFLLWMLPLIYSYYKKVFIWQILVVLLALFSIGSKTGVVGTSMVMLCIMFFDFRKSKIEERITRKKVLVATIFIFLFITIGVYIIKDYINELINLFHSGWYTSFSGFLLSNRNGQLTAMKNFLLGHNGGLIGILMGYGYSGVQYMLQQTRIGYKAIERDFHGVYYNFGLVILVILIYYLISLLVKAFYLNKKHKFLNEKYFALLLFWCIGIVYGYLGGHVLYEALGQFPFWIIGALIEYSYRKERYLAYEK